MPHADTVWELSQEWNGLVGDESVLHNIALDDCDPDNVTAADVERVTRALHMLYEAVWLLYPEWPRR
jgi:hypothetical protein